jgi:hypothetical protein
MIPPFSWWRRLLSFLTNGGHSISRKRASPDGHATNTPIAAMVVDVPGRGIGG